MPKAIPQQIELPYPVIDKVGTRDQMRKVAAFLGKQTYHIPFSVIKIREGFNVRVKPPEMSEPDWLAHLHIEELANDISQNGLMEPLQGDLLPDGTFTLTDGYRRYLAVKWLLENCHTEQANGKPMDVVEVIPNPAGTTEKDRVIRMLSSDKKLPFNEIEMAHGIKRLKDCFKMTNQEIADQMGRSRQWVDNKLKLTTLPEDTQKAIAAGDVKSTNAIAELRNPLKADKTITPDEKERLTESFGSPDAFGAWSNFEEEEVIHVSPTAKEKTETAEALQAEMDSRKTEAKFKETRPKSDQKDALAKVDFSQEKTEAEMDLNEVSAMIDKITVRIGKFPKALHQDINDIQMWAQACQKKIANVKEIIKKAADER